MLAITVIPSMSGCLLLRQVTNTEWPDWPYLEKKPEFCYLFEGFGEADLVRSKERPRKLLMALVLEALKHDSGAWKFVKWAWRHGITLDGWDLTLTEKQAKSVIKATLASEKKHRKEHRKKQTHRKGKTHV